MSVTATGPIRTQVRSTERGRVIRPPWASLRRSGVTWAVVCPSAPANGRIRPSLTPPAPGLSSRHRSDRSRPGWETPTMKCPRCQHDNLHPPEVLWGMWDALDGVLIRAARPRPRRACRGSRAPHARLTEAWNNRRPQCDSGRSPARPPTFTRSWKPLRGSPRGRAAQLMVVVPGRGRPHAKVAEHQDGPQLHPRVGQTRPITAPA